MVPMERMFRTVRHSSVQYCIHLQWKENPLGLVFSLNFSTAFNTSQNLTSIFTYTSKASGGGAANNIGPNYEDGVMFANDYQWVTYAGLLDMTNSYSPPGEGAFATDELYPSRPDEVFEPGYALGQLPTGITRYVTYGAGVSVPSENLGFYFSGLRSASHGPIYDSPGPGERVSECRSAILDINRVRHESSAA